MPLGSDTFSDADLPDPVVDDVRTAFAGIDFADAATQVIVEIPAGDASRVAGAVEQTVDHDLFGEIGGAGDLGLNRHAFVRRFEPGSAHALVAVNIDGDLLGSTWGGDPETGEAGEGSAGPHSSGLVGFGIEPALAPGVPKPVGLQEALLAFGDAVTRGQIEGAVAIDVHASPGDLPQVVVFHEKRGGSRRTGFDETPRGGIVDLFGHFDAVIRAGAFGMP